MEEVVKLGKILGDHGMFAPFNSKLSTTFIITLPSAESLMSAQTGETTNFPRQSLKAVVMLFRNKTVIASEEFVFPNIETVKKNTIEGMPSQIYSQGIPKKRFYDEAKRLFVNGADNPLMTIRSFYKKHFAIVIDLRNIEDNNVFQTGRKLTSTESGIPLEIQKKATTADVDCHIFVISDGII